MMPPWEVAQDDGMAKALKNLKGNAPAMDGLVRIMEDMRICKDPAVFGKRKRWKYSECYGVHLTKSVSLIYKVDYASHTVYALDVGDHKWLYGRDNRS